MAKPSRPSSALPEQAEEATTVLTRAEFAREPERQPYSAALRLANWLKFHETSVDHLRLQKLLFYSYGAGLAYGFAQEIGGVRFHAWKHGPVNLEVYRAHRGSGCGVLQRPSQHEVAHYSAGLEQVLRDVLAVYGRLSSWQLREESHGELPWNEAPQSSEIAPSKILAHFIEKFAVGQVRMPKNLLRAWSFRVDGVPLQRWHDLHALALELQT